MLAVILALALGQAPRPALLLPNPKLTPGATLPVRAIDVCRPGYAKATRAVPSAVKAEVFRRYGVTPRPGEYEVDHLISLELGGSNAITNLWPQPYAGPMGAHQKDKLEDWLHREVCAGRMTLHAAQTAIRSDWTKAYARAFPRACSPRVR